jgi:hypothetical protein
VAEISLHLAKETWKKIEDCKVAPCRIACGGDQAGTGRRGNDLLFVLTNEKTLFDTSPR